MTKLTLSSLKSRAVQGAAFAALLSASPQVQAGAAVQTVSLQTAFLAEASITQGFGFVLSILAAIFFIMGTIWVVQGSLALKRGEEGKMSIVGGILTAVAVPIMRFIFNKVMPEAGIDNIRAGQLN